EFFLGTLLTYADTEPSALPDLSAARATRVPVAEVSSATGSVGVGMLGAGNFAQTTLLPALKRLRGVSFIGVCNATGPRSRRAAEKFGFSYCSTSEAELLQDPTINAIVIATRNHLHASQSVAALRAGKAVFCEKPLCLNEDELASVVRVASARNSPLLLVGFNRRFATMAVQMKAFLSEIHEPLAIHYRVNAGFIPADHWVNDLEQGGGRILGELCHFADFLCFLAGACPSEVQVETVGNPGQYSLDNVVASLKFANGTLGTISYLANGERSASKERIEVFGGGAVAILEDFRRLELIRGGRKQITRARWNQDKGHQAEMRAFVDALRGKTASPIPLEEIMGSTLTTLRLQNSCQIRQPLPVELSEFVALALQEKSTEEAD